VRIEKGAERLPLAIWGGRGVSTERPWRRSALARSGVAAMGGGGGGENPRAAGWGGLGTEERKRAGGCGVSLQLR
jgi:hypothetical protein